MPKRLTGKVFFSSYHQPGGAMDGVSGVNAGASIEAVNQILMAATQQSMEAVDKLMKLTVATAVGQEAGKGQNFDAIA
jgi:hypothetical protein